jgi:uncharacterized protein YdeI (BOF family)
MKKKILFFSLIFFSTLLYAQNVIYVATNGSDETGNGTFESPYASVQFALNQANDNDTIILRGGTYQSNEIRIDRNNITIKYNFHQL